MQVRDLMRTDCVMLDREKSVQLAIKKMLINDSSCVIAVDGNSPLGVLTRERILHVLYQADEPPENIRIMNAAHAPRLKLRPGMTIRKAADEMGENEQQVAFVMDGLEIAGILTVYDILSHHKLAIKRTDNTHRNKQKEWSGGA